MEDFIVLVLLLLLIAVPILRWVKSRQRRAEEETRWNDLSDRVAALERGLNELRAAMRASSRIETPAADPRTQAGEVAAGPLPHAAQNPEEQAPLPELATFETTLVSPSTVLEAEQQRAATTASSAKPRNTWQQYLEARLAPDEMIESFAKPRSAALPSEHFGKQKAHTLLERFKGGFDLEEALGTNWLNKIGVVILVFGIAFFLAYQLRELGPAGKVLVGWVVSGVLLGGGIFLERKPGYALLGRAGIGGGWALAFFTAYAMYHVEAAHVLSSQGVDLALMGLVAAAMVAHSLRYRSQSVTGLAFLLAFSTVTISHVTVYSLAAGAVLALALVAVVLRMQWYELEVFGLIAAYLNHFYWLWHIIEPMHGHKHAFAEFVPSAAILLLYWLIFRCSYMFRRIDNQNQERIATASALLNSFGLLGLFKYQSVHPEWAFWALLVLGALEAGMALLVRLRRRPAFIVLMTIGVTLLFAAFPFRFAAMNVSLMWVAGIEALLLAGVAVRERVFCRLAYAATIAATVQMLAVQSARVLGIRMDDAMPGRILPLGFALAFAAAIFYANSTYVYRRWRDFFDDLDTRILQGISYGSMLLLAASLWIAFPGAEAAPAWAVAGLVLALLSSRVATPDLKIQGDLLAVGAFLRALIVNLESTAHWGPVSQRLITVALCAAAMYAGSRVRPERRWDPLRIPEAYTWVGSTLVVLLLWYELHAVSIAPAWAAFGLVLLEIGLQRRSLHLRLQGYCALAGCIVRVFIANLAAAGMPGEISPRMYSTVPVIAVLAYAYLRLAGDESSVFAEEHRFHAAELCAWAGLACFVALVRFELQSDWVVVAWAALTLVLLALAFRSGRLLFLQQALVLVWFVVFRGAMHNLYERSLVPAPFLYSRILCVGTACALLLASLPLAYNLSGRQPAVETRSKFKRAIVACLRRPEQILFFGPWVLLISLLGAEMNKGLLTVSWSVLGVSTFLFALWLKERSFRLAGLGLLLSGVGKIVVIDVWSLGERDRYLTFISMGIALLLVSFLYTRYREAIRHYL